ncbi:MAG TPA: helix-turn-helix transcriptional regulator [Rhodanobacteraceae bacterium]|jgi:transcriptional regulator with XRE-family HTH domain|nr:helix-turn-helix transcriptional regulator [Rhodanobacteraceae bacterium]
MTPRELQRRLGLVVRRHRERLKYSQEAFAGAADIHRTYYGNIERGTQNFSMEYLLKISLILNVPLSKLFEEAETLDLPSAVREPHSPPRVGRPPGRKSRWRE